MIHLPVKSHPCTRLLAIMFALACSVQTQASTADSTKSEKPRSFLSKVVAPFEKFFAGTDTNYIEPNHYNFQAMLQNRYSYEVYRLTDDKGNSIRFEPKPSLKIGPYAGWSLIFLGWTVDILHISDGNKRKEWDLSLYTLPLGIDFYYRKSGNGYTIKNIHIPSIGDTHSLEGRNFSGIESSVSGLDIYYIFNHKRFSYPAAYNQSTQQKRSAGSALAGLGFTRHTLSVDWQMLNDIFTTELGKDLFANFNEEPISEKVVYTDLSVSGGYAYNWVFAKDWLFGSSLSVALSRKKAIADSERGFGAVGTTFRNLRDFKFSDLTIDGVGRFGVVWNNGKMFAGASAIVHSYNYSKSKFYTNNLFGSFTAYFGINLGVKNEYKNHNKKK